MWRYLIMKDINGFEIWVGQKVKTLQPRGGFLNPAPAQIGIVEFNENLCKKNELVIRYRIEGRDFDQFILLNGKINEIVSFNCYYCGTFENLMKDGICCVTCWNEEMKKDWNVDLVNAT